MCGSTCDWPLLSTMKHDDESKFNPDASALVIKGGKVYQVMVNSDNICEWAELDYNFTLGSGGSFALAAMDFCRSAKDAVKYASTRDVYTGGKIRVVKVNT